MTYGNQVPTPEAASAAAPTGRHRAAGPDSPMDGLLQDADDPGGPIVTADDVVFRLPDPGHQLDGVRLEVDWILGDINPEFTWDDGLWSLPIARPDAWRLEYQLTVRLWSPTGLHSDTTAPLLLVHDGSDMAERGSLLSWATSMSRDRPIRVALLDPAHGLRDKWYSADPDYSDHLADAVLPALTSLVLTGPVIGLGASLGALGMLALQRRHPGSISALALQSGSFFTVELDSQESGYSFFEQICAAVRLMSAGPDMSTDSTPRPVPVVITVGSIEENRFNNEAMAAAMKRQHHPVTVRIVPDAHTMIGWRDAWFPALDELIRPLR